MVMKNPFSGLFSEPPPQFVFELSGEGLAVSTRGEAPQFLPFEADTVRVSPIEDNILRTDSFLRTVRIAAGPETPRKRKTAVLVLPDYAARMAVLDFDQFPSKPEEQTSLLRFRLKKTVPFDVDTAALSYTAKQRPGGKAVDVVATMASYEILNRYEAPFRSAGIWPGRVTVSTLSALDLLPEDGCRVLVKLAGRVLTVAVTLQGSLRVLRCVELATVDEEEMGNVLYPTLAYVEDELKAVPQSIHVCGLAALPEGLPAPVEPLHSSFGVPSPLNAGLLGYLASGGRN